MEFVYEILVKMPGCERDRLVPLKKLCNYYTDAKHTALKYFLDLDVTDVVFGSVYDTDDGGTNTDIFVLIYNSPYANGEIEKIKVGIIHSYEVNNERDITLDTVD